MRRMHAYTAITIVACLFVSGGATVFADTAPASTFTGDSGHETARGTPVKHAYVYTGHPEVTAGLAELRGLVNDTFIRWMAGLYDPATGGFYYSNSARDTAGFYPDIESTSQVLRFMRDSLGVKRLPLDMEKRLIAFFQERQDPGTGYFYDKQFGSQVGQSKKDRNLGEAVARLAWLGAKPLYQLPEERALATRDAAQPEASPLPSHYASKEAFVSYLERLDWSHPYPSGNGLASASATIRKMGYHMALLDFLCATQNPKTGLWGRGCTYEEISGGMKLSGFFALGSDRAYPHAERMLESVISVMTTRNPPRTIVEIRNPFDLLNRALLSEKHVYSPSIDRTLREHLPAMIHFAIRNLKRFKQGDHGYSYFTGRSSPTSQGARVSLGIPEGDLNGGTAGCVATIDLVHSLAGSDPATYKPFQALFFQALAEAAPRAATPAN